MGSDLDLKGVHVPLVTPFTAHGDVAYDEVERLAHAYLDAGAGGLVALGTTGEPATLGADERVRVVEVVAQVCRSRDARLLVGPGTNSTAAAVAQAVEAGSVDGVSGVLSVVPYYTRPSEDGIVAHFRAVAAASPVPVVVYNIPYRTGRGLGPDALLALAATPNVAGLKQAVGGVDVDTLTVLAEAPADFQVLCGDDAFLFPMLCSGAVGGILASAHVCTQAFVALVDAVAKGEVAVARELSELLLPVCRALFVEPSPAVTKGVLAARGAIGSAGLRAPMTEASPGAVAAAVEAVAAAERAFAAR